MPKPDTKYQQLAADAEDRIRRAHERGQQLTFLADEVPMRDPDAPKRGKGKALSQMRGWLVSRGYQLPEEMLAQLAGLHTGESVLAGAMRETEEVLLWALDGAAKDKKGNLVKPTMHQRLTTLQQVLAVRLRAADALLPYGLAKVSGDAPPSTPVTIVMPGAGSGGDQARPMRDVSPAGGSRMAPPPMPDEIKQKQEVSEAVPSDPDEESRTE